jgi:hypothetical protein
MESNPIGQQHPQKAAVTPTNKKYYLPLIGSLLCSILTVETFALYSKIHWDIMMRVYFISLEYGIAKEELAGISRSSVAVLTHLSWLRLFFSLMALILAIIAWRRGLRLSWLAIILAMFALGTLLIVM